MLSSYGRLSEKDVDELWEHASSKQPACVGTAALEGASRSAIKMTEEGLKLYFHHQYAVLGTVVKDGEDYFALQNPHNKVKKGFGPVRNVKDVCDAQCDTGLVKVSRGPTLKPDDQYDNHAADSVLVPRKALSTGDVFNACTLFFIA